MSEFKWFASTDQEVYMIGPCDTRDEVIAQAEKSDLGLKQDDSGNWCKLSFFIIEVCQDPIDLSDHVNFDAFIENMHVSVDDEHGGEDSEILQYAWTSEQEQELDAAMQALVMAWQKKHNIVVTPWQFTSQRNLELIQMTVPLPVR